jgi:glutamate synthase (NADPH) small chain
MAPLLAKERMKIPRQDMPVQEADVRAGNFEEVALGFTLELARMEAERCLQCARPQCVDGCPVGVQIPEFIKALRDGDMVGAVQAMKAKNNLPAICGRVCPQEVQCESRCLVGRKNAPVAIGRLERFVGDFELRERTCPPTRGASTGKKVAVVGSGPSGLTCAVDVARLGHSVTIFESLQNPGGVLVYGIPEFRLPKAVINAEIEFAAGCLGIDIRTDYIIGRTLTIDELLQEYDAVFMGTGAGLPSFMRIPGINFNGVLSANEFLTRVNLMKGYQFPQYDTPVKIGRKVAVVGAGNVAMDAARCSLRLMTQQARLKDQQPGEVHIVYRRSREEVPARLEEVHHAEEEGIIFDFLTNPAEIYGDERGNVRGMRCIRQQLGEPDASGRRSPVPIPGSEFDMDVDTVIMALGTSPNPLVFVDAEGLQRTRHGTVVADQDSGRTTMPKVWAGGDVVTGAATVISAMGAGKRAAADIDRFLNGDATW